MAAAEFPRDLAAVLRFSAHYANATEDALRPAVRQAFGCDLIRYRQRLVRAVQTPGAEAVAPTEVNRLRRILEDAATRRHRSRVGADANRRK